MPSTVRKLTTASPASADVSVSGKTRLAVPALPSATDAAAIATTALSSSRIVPVALVVAALPGNTAPPATLLSVNTKVSLASALPSPRIGTETVVDSCPAAISTTALTAV